MEKLKEILIRIVEKSLKVDCHCSINQGAASSLIQELQNLKKRIKGSRFENKLKRIEKEMFSRRDTYGNVYLKIRIIGQLQLLLEILEEEVGKKTKIFISHSSKDKEIVNELVDLLEKIGIKDKEALFCSSIQGYGIDIGEDIYERLQKEFENYNVYVIFILSKNYYESNDCLNEMGATWVLKNKYQTLLSPGFEYAEIKGAINPTQKSFKLDEKTTRIENLIKLKEELIEIFDLEKIDEILWRRYEESFFKKIDCLIEIKK
ncbi:MAG: toll/interleukin-1 receptor domain-containing protein [Bacilli bacterium]